MALLHAMTNSLAYMDGEDHQLRTTYVCADHRAFLMERGHSDTWGPESIELPAECCELCAAAEPFVPEVVFTDPVATYDRSAYTYWVRVYEETKDAHPETTLTDFLNAHWQNRPREQTDDV